MTEPTGGGEPAAPLPLSGTRAVEVGPGIAGAFAGKWLAALGAEVVKVEPPEGDPARRAGPFPGDAPDAEASGRFLALNAGKESAVLDLATRGGVADLERLIRGADLLLDTLPGAGIEALGPLAARLAALHPALVRVSISPFGRTGPFADLPATPLTLGALSGTLWHVGEPGRPPLAQGGSQPEYLGGLHALGAALAGLLSAAATGRGRSFDLSLQACGAAVMGHYTARASQLGGEGRRLPPRALWRLYRAADGWAGVCGLRRNYEPLAQALGIPEIARSSPFLDRENQQEQERRLAARVAEWFATRSCKEVRELALRRRVPLATVLSIQEVAESEQLASRAFFATDLHPRAGRLLLPARLWRSPAHGWAAGRAPSLGAHTGQALAAAGSRAAASAAPAGPAPGPAAPERGPLAGLRVLDLGQIWAGPYAAMLLADQGAEVIKVESPTNWDPNRCAARPPAGWEAQWWDTCAFFQEYNHNKRALGLDLRHPEGRALLGELVARSDAVIENFRAGVLDRLGVGYAWLRERRPDVILVSMAAFGLTGPERDLPGYGPMIEQTSGLAGVTGYGDGKPQLASYAYGDPVAAVAGAAAVLVALLQRRSTGAGQHIDLAQREVATALLGEAFVEWSLFGRQPAVRGNGHAWMAPHNVYPCAGDDEWVAIAVGSPAEWEGLCAALGRPAWAKRPEYAEARTRWERRQELDARIAEWTRARPKTEVFERCRERGVPAGPVWKMGELLVDPQLASRGFYETVSHPAAGSWRCHGWVWREPGAGPCLRRRAPDFGEGNREILGGELGLSPAELARLEAAGVVAGRPVGVPELDAPAAVRSSG